MLPRTARGHNYSGAEMERLPVNTARWTGLYSRTIKLSGWAIKRPELGQEHNRRLVRDREGACGCVYVFVEEGYHRVVMSIAIRGNSNPIFF